MFNTNEWLQWARQNQENNPIGTDFRSTYWKNGAKPPLSMSLTESIQQVVNEAVIDKDNPSMFPKLDKDAERDAAAVEAQTKLKAEQERQKAEADAKSKSDAKEKSDADATKEPTEPKTVTTATGTYKIDEPGKELTKKQKLGANLKSGMTGIATGAAWQVGGEIADKITSSTGLDKFIKKKEDQGRGVNLSGASNTDESVAMGVGEVIKKVLGSRLGKAVKKTSKYLAQGAAFQKGAELVTPKPKNEIPVTTSQQQQEEPIHEIAPAVGWGIAATVATIAPQVIGLFSSEPEVSPINEPPVKQTQTPNPRISHNLNRLQSSKVHRSHPRHQKKTKNVKALLTKPKKLPKIK